MFYEDDEEDEEEDMYCESPRYLEASRYRDGDVLYVNGHEYARRKVDGFDKVAIWVLYSNNQPRTMITLKPGSHIEVRRVPT
jgi:hypothetical protein